MKIVVTTNLYPPHFLGGYELGCKDVVDALVARGHHVTVITSVYGVNTAEIHETIYRVMKHFWGTYPSGGLQLNYLQSVRAKWFSLRNYRLVSRILRQERPDVVYHWGLDRISPLSVLAVPRMQKIPSVIHLMDDWLYQMKIQNIGKPVFPVSAIKSYCKLKLDSFLYEIPLLLMSRSLAEDYAAQGFPKDKMTVVYPAIPYSNTALPAPRSPDGSFKLIYAGQLGEWKGVHVVLEALIKLKKQEEKTHYVLDIAGEGAPGYVRLLQQIASKNLISCDIKFLGKKSRDEIFKIIPEYDALVFPTLRKEPFGFVMLEAMMAGAPVIASACGGPLEFIEPGKTGLLVKPGNPVELADAILYLAKDREQWFRIRQTAFNAAHEKCDFNSYIKKIEENLVKAVERNK